MSNSLHQNALAAPEATAVNSTRIGWDQRKKFGAV